MTLKQNKLVRAAQIINIFLMMNVLIGLISCEDIIEKDISTREMVLIAPGDNLRTSFSTQTFWWEALDGATSYNLQVVSPSFASIEKVLMDTTIKKNKFTLNLFPGKFEWRVRALNGTFKTPYIQRWIQIDSTMDLKGQKVTLMLPLENAFTNLVTSKFHWLKLYNANSYTIEIHKNTWDGEAIFTSEPVINDTVSVNNLAEGIYTWGIKAWNTNSATDFVTRVMTIDRTAPGVPSLSTPSDKAKIGQLPVSLVWTNAADTGTPLTDSLLVSTDSLFSTQKTVVVKFLQETKLDNAVQDTGTYYWKVKSVDAAQNQSAYTLRRKFTVQSK